MTTRGTALVVSLMLAASAIGGHIALVLGAHNQQSLAFACGFIAGQATSVSALGNPISPEADDCRAIRIQAIKDGLTADVVKNAYGKPL